MNGCFPVCSPKGKGGCEGVCRDQEASVASLYDTLCVTIFLSLPSKQQQTLQFIVILNFVATNGRQITEKENRLIRQPQLPADNISDFLLYQIFALDCVRRTLIKSKENLFNLKSHCGGEAMG